MLHFSAHTATPQRPPDAPRAVPSKAVAWMVRFFLIFVVPWFGIAVTCTTVFTLVGGPIWDDWILDARGVKTTARAYRVELTSMRHNRRTYRRIHARFKDPSGKQHHVSYITLKQREISAGKNHGVFAVEYDPQNPSRNRVRGNTASLFGKWVLLPLGVALALAIPLFLLLRARSRQRRTYRNGEPVLGRVERVKRTSGRQNNRPVMRVHYVFESPAGDTINGTVETLEPPPVGTPLWVLFDRDNPRRNVAALPLPGAR
ncbi:MAG: hypothetical protein KC503_07095 [Myxococcales bacterium]|nr:hypothetical protein [Myxococcales bacterium]